MSDYFKKYAGVKKQGTTVHMNMPQLHTLACATYKITHFLKTNKQWKNPLQQTFAAFVRFHLAFFKGMVSDVWHWPVDTSCAQVMKTDVFGIACAGGLLGTIMMC